MAPQSLPNAFANGKKILQSTGCGCRSGSVDAVRSYGYGTCVALTTYVAAVALASSSSPLSLAFRGSATVTIFTAHSRK